MASCPSQCMNSENEQCFLDVINGTRGGLAVGALRSALALVEPFYAGAMTLRNHLYDFGIKQTIRLAAPTLSVGNLTAGGTGKTPMVRLLASHFRDARRHVAILSRGYKTVAGRLGDEQRMLNDMLNAVGQNPVILQANPDRAIAANAAR